VWEFLISRYTPARLRVFSALSDYDDAGVGTGGLRDQKKPTPGDHK
jgi:hypothetical protein